MLFVDTNVFIYARQAGAPAKQRLARAWIEHAWREHSGRTSMQVLSEYYVNVTRKADPPVDPHDAWDDVKALMTWNPLPVDREVLEVGRGVEMRYRLSWWDALIVAAAQLQGCTLLLSDDLQDGANYGGVTVRSPFTLNVSEAVAAYRVSPVVTPRHRPPGRPRKVAAQPA